MRKAKKVLFWVLLAIVTILFRKKAQRNSNYLRELQSAPGRTRTCNQRIRNPLLYPLSYGRMFILSNKILCSSDNPHQ